MFFVLSGFVIAYTATQKNKGGMQYLQARFSRLYSVVIPALLITGIIQFTVHHLNVDLYSHFTRGLSFPRYLMSSLFVNEIWFLSAAPPINGPLWSLSYEFWYYMIFGLFLYRRKGWKWLIPGFIGCLIAGPKILIMMPIWLAGYLAYRMPRPNISKRASWILFTLFITLSLLIIIYVPPFPFEIGGANILTFASQFLTDWMTGIFVVLAIWIIPPFESQNKPSTLMKQLRNFADITFPIYVLHYPFMILYDALGFAPIKHTWQLWSPIIFVLTATILFGLLLEKYRSLWTKLFKNLFSKLATAKIG